MSSQAFTALLRTPISSIPFDEIVPGFSVRLAVIDGVQYLSILDIIMCVCNKNNNEAGAVWRNLHDSRKNEVQQNLLTFKFPGRGQQDQPVITFPGALKLIMFLPGNVAAMHRSSMVTILQRYFAGDPSLLAEVEANRLSESPVSKLARASLASESIEDAQDRKRKREREDAELHALKLQNLNVFKTLMDDIRPQWRGDTRLILQTEDLVKNIIFNQGQPAITNGDEGTQPNKSISISQVAQEMGFRLQPGQLTNVGKIAAAKYRFKYDEDVPKHFQWVDGAERKVNSYTERDRDLIVEALSDAGFNA